MMISWTEGRMGPGAEPIGRTRQAPQLPGHAVWTAIGRMSAAAARVETALEPSLLRRMMGGVNRELCRAIVEASLEESGAVRRTLAEAIRLAGAQAHGLSELATGGGEGADAARSAASQAHALLGTCERVRDLVDRWIAAASAHQEGVIGASETLLIVTKRIRALAREIGTPASGLGGKER